MARIDERALALSSALTARERSLMGESMQPEARDLVRDLADVELLRGDVPGEDEGW